MSKCQGWSSDMLHQVHRDDVFVQVDVFQPAHLDFWLWTISASVEMTVTVSLVSYLHLSVALL